MVKCEIFSPVEPRTAPTFLERWLFFCCFYFVRLFSPVFVLFGMWLMLYLNAHFHFTIFHTSTTKSLPFFVRESFFTHALSLTCIYIRTHTLTYIQAFTRRTRTHAICTLERVPSNKRRQKNIGHNLPNYLHAFGRHFRTRLIKFHPRNKNRFKYNFIKHQLKRNQNKKTLRHNYWN